MVCKNVVDARQGLLWGIHPLTKNVILRTRIETAHVRIIDHDNNVVFPNRSCLKSIASWRLTPGTSNSSGLKNDKGSSRTSQSVSVGKTKGRVGRGGTGTGDETGCDCEGGEELSSSSSLPQLRRWEGLTNNDRCLQWSNGQSREQLH
ncbi:hypothetical protein K474DRAFT_1660212, partial [Panus rudis PR-1116 ss-1]